MIEMTPERFIALVEAYGADRRRWPETDRASAEAFATAHPEVAGPALAEADDLDALLHRSPTPQVSIALRDRVIAAAGAAPRAGRRWANRLGLAFGAGWAAAAAAGVVAGVVLTGHLTADVQADAVLYQASLLGMDDTEVLG
ncbi:hypothetical protein [Brevundimonas sp. Root1279]|uniref:hypothetical protein n=1 Tax=Brevundimonas sp. Root1279 TaxID=1736443 RepID=UPI001F4660B3|nr:hypothetical protein [Brevundimonas sp. Root1279]